MNCRQWQRWFVLFVVSVGLAIGCTRLLASQANLWGASGYQLGDLTSGNATFVAFPANYKQQFVQYATVDCPNSQMVRKMYVNPQFLEAIETNQTVPSGTVIVMETHTAAVEADGQLVPQQLSNVFIREKRSDWNLANSGEWQSAWYSPSGALVSSDQSSCIGCHTMVRDRDYLFTLPALMTAAQTKQLQKQPTEFSTSVCR